MVKNRVFGGPKKGGPILVPPTTKNYRAKIDQKSAKKSIFSKKIEKKIAQNDLKNDFWPKKIVPDFEPKKKFSPILAPFLPYAFSARYPKIDQKWAKKSIFFEKKIRKFFFSPKMT